MISRSERLLLKSVFTDFSEQKCSPSNFTAQLEPFFHSQDQAVKELSQSYAMIYEYEKGNGSPPEKIYFDKSEWDELQRVLLFLGSDVPYAKPQSCWRFDPFQIMAIVALFGAIWRYVALAVPFEMITPAAVVVLIALCRIRYLSKRDSSRASIPQEKLYPFLCVQTIIRQLRLQPDFEKKRFCAPLSKTMGIGDRIISGIMAVGIFLILWPCLLLLLCLPGRREKH